LKLLLDTHVWLWRHVAPTRLRPRVRQALDDPANECWLSPISVWELSTLARKRRIVLDRELRAWVAAAREEVPWREAVLNFEVALAADRLLMHADPADRFLAATAQVYGLTLVTADQQLMRLESIDHLAN